MVYGEGVPCFEPFNSDISLIFWAYTFQRISTLYNLRFNNSPYLYKISTTSVPAGRNDITIVLHRSTSSEVVLHDVNNKGIILEPNRQKAKVYLYKDLG
jgi:hypothetical protein